jgi:PPOX class probable F420-dependent enzyme
MTVAESIAHVSNRFYDAIRSGEAREAAERPAVKGDLDSLSGQKYFLLTTYKRSGEPVSTPLWFGLADGKLYFRTYADTAKLKRIRREPRVLVGPCDPRGKPKGPMIEARAHPLSSDEESVAEQAIRSNYGVFRRIYLATFSGRVADTYVEVTPV